MFVSPPQYIRCLRRLRLKKIIGEFEFRNSIFRTKMFSKLAEKGFFHSFLVGPPTTTRSESFSRIHFFYRLGSAVTFHLFCTVFDKKIRFLALFPQNRTLTDGNSCLRFCCYCYQHNNPTKQASSFEKLTTSPMEPRSPSRPRIPGSP